ncbi:MAG: hypothetical protein UX94_C0003G0018 [Parcubacteria group bacterium GW2011_GWA2_47_21]|nr:MAG: hypothetical protein UX94_C0003G0018 [Parcubacteria group bacterium GW2011_GWA2_47_21]
MDNVSKFVASLPEKDRLRIIETLAFIRGGQTSGLDIKKLKGYADIFRVRVGKYRIICRKQEPYRFIIIKVTHRNDTTYNF